MAVVFRVTEALTLKRRTSDADVGKGPQCHVPRCNTSGRSGSSRNAQIEETSAASSKATSAGATAITAVSSRTMSVCVCVSWRYSVSHRRPRGLPEPRTGDARLCSRARPPTETPDAPLHRAGQYPRPVSSQTGPRHPGSTEPVRSARRLRRSSLVSSPVGRSAGVLHFGFLTIQLCFEPAGFLCRRPPPRTGTPPPCDCSSWSAAGSGTRSDAQRGLT